jgi:hypothetical protein
MDSTAAELYILRNGWPRHCKTLSPEVACDFLLERALHVNGEPFAGCVPHRIVETPGWSQSGRTRRSEPASDQSLMGGDGLRPVLFIHRWSAGGQLARSAMQGQNE